MGSFPRPRCTWRRNVAGLAVVAGLGLGAAYLAAAEPAAVTPRRTLVVAQRHPAAADTNPGTPDQPFLTLARAAREVAAGDAVRVEEGVYRETVRIEASGTPEAPIVFAAAPCANVTVTGADRIAEKEWTREPGEANVYSTAWAHVFLGWSPSRTHPADDYHQTIGRVEQVFVDNYALLQVATRAQLGRGTFWVDEPGQRLYLWDRTNQDLAQARQVVEVSVRPVLWECLGAQVTVRGFRFRRAANQNQHGAVLLKGVGDTLEDCVVEEMNSVGASLLADRVTARRCVFRDNGQLGFSAHGADLLVTGCVCERNNAKNVARGWEAGGNKLVLCRRAVIEASIFRDNRGNGLWFDIGNEDCEVRNCLIVNNEDAGIFYEISYGLNAHDNVIVGNGLPERHGAWGANGGIALSSSVGCVVERNLLVGNCEGVQFREQGRTTPRIDGPPGEVAIWNHGHRVRRNLIAYNRDWQAGGWFDVKDAFHWPRAGQAGKDEGGLKPRAELPAGADLERLAAKPVGLALEDLGLESTGNLFAVRPGQGLYLWGCLWHRHVAYADPAAVQAELGLESGSRVAPVEFADWSVLDLRVAADSPAATMGCYPRGEVPGVRLGMLPR